VIQDQLKNDLRAIILFGSAARGECKLGSDIDLLVVTDMQLNREQRSTVRAEVYDGCTLDVDLVFYSRNVYNESDSIFINNVKKDGKLLWLK
jgi:predicted nucleotidyltransferase